MFNVANALFVTDSNNSATFQPSPNSYVHPDHLAYFKFIGRVVGKALYDGQLLDAHFTRSFYKHILGTPITYEDIEAIDPDYYKNLKWMLQNDITNVLDLNFSAELDHFGKHAVRRTPEHEGRTDPTRVTRADARLPPGGTGLAGVSTRPAGLPHPWGAISRDAAPPTLLLDEFFRRIISKCVWDERKGG